MKPEIQRVLIAEACGWKVADHCITKRMMRGEGARALRGAPPDFGYAPDGWTIATSNYSLPDFVNDLNAMHEAEKVLTERQWMSYYENLYQRYGSQQAVHATAAHKSEAFLKATGKWEAA